MVLKIEGSIEVCSVTEFAKLMGCSKQSIHKWMQKGMPILRTGELYIVPIEDAKKWLRKRKLRWPLLYEGLEND